MTPLYYANAWYGREVSSRARKGTKFALGKLSSNPNKWDSSLDVSATTLGTAGVLATSGAAHLPHMILGGSPYVYAMNLSSKAQKAHRVVNLYNMGFMAKAMYIAKPTNFLKGYLMQSWLPSKATAKKAARTAKIAGRFAPIIGAVALAHDIYDIAVNRSFWGIQFGNPTP